MPGKIKTTKTSRDGWKIVFQYLFDYKKEVIFLSVLGVISALANGGVPYVVGKFFDAILEPALVFTDTSAEMQLWVALIILFGIIQALANSVDWINDKRSRKIGLLLVGDYISNAYSYLLRLPFSFHKDQKTGKIFEKINKGSSSLTIIIEQIILRLAPQILSVIVGLSIAFYIHPTLAILLVAGILLYIGTLFKIVPPIVNLQRRGHKAWSDAWGDAYSALSNVHAVKNFTAEKYESRKIRNRFVNIAGKIWYKVESIWSAINFYQRIIVVLTQISIFVLSVYFIGQETLTIGELIALNGYAALVFGPFMTLARNWQAVQKGITAIEQAEEMLRKPTEVYSPIKAVKLKKIKGNIEFQNVSFEYKKGDRQVLDGIDIKVNAGEVVALVGESGVGKSTTIDLISGYYFPTKGNILIDKYDIKKINLTFLRENIAVVPQEVVLFNDTIRANIKYGNLKTTDEEIKHAAKEARADVFIEKFPQKYNQIVGERGIKLSVGEKQRIAIARAILRNPKILILDEPTSALDVETEHFLQKTLQKLMEGRTTFIVAHRLSTVRKADKIFVFEKGKIIESGKHEDLIKKENGVYRRLHDLHIGLR
ncbi:hypothetical protein CL630_00205 [bacterium]|nr:hypothetical protein [bacterium]|tara:strand:- start:4491 stop:6281 length:1791 start_codon:yes stop_codon:yes gene_type:complete